jgi:ABC-type nitrate/sulfonate/bicarbonate transport system substrate-binding protein
VSEFSDLEKKAEDFVEQHPEQADQGVDKVAGIAKDDTDHQHDDRIDRAVDAADKHLGQDQPGDQN